MPLPVQAPVVNAVCFSPPNAGPAAFAERFNKLVNARRIVFANDIINQVWVGGPPTQAPTPACRGQRDRHVLVATRCTAACLPACLLPCSPAQVPCGPSMPACAASPGGLLGSLGITAVPTNQNNATSWPYQAVGGSLVFSPSQMPVVRSGDGDAGDTCHQPHRHDRGMPPPTDFPALQDTAVWETIKDIPLCWAGDYIQAR